MERLFRMAPGKGEEEEEEEEQQQQQEDHLGIT
jgi:hypothetical protein